MKAGVIHHLPMSRLNLPGYNRMFRKDVAGRIQELHGFDGKIRQVDIV